MFRFVVRAFLIATLAGLLALSHYAVYYVTKTEFFKLGMIYGIISAATSSSGPNDLGQDGV